MLLYILSNLPCLFRVQVPARRYCSFQLNYKLYLLSCRHVFIWRWLCCLITSFTTIYFFYGTVIIPWEYFKQLILPRALYFVQPIAAIHDIKRTGFTSRTTAQKNKIFPIKNLFTKCDQICKKLRIWSHLLKKSLLENFIFCAVNIWRILSLFEKSNCSLYFFKVSFFSADLLCYPAILWWWMC